MIKYSLKFLHIWHPVCVPPVEWCHLLVATTGGEPLRHTTLARSLAAVRDLRAEVAAATAFGDGFCWFSAGLLARSGREEWEGDKTRGRKPAQSTEMALLLLWSAGQFEDTTKSPGVTMVQRWLTNESEGAWPNTRGRGAVTSGQSRDQVAKRKGDIKGG